ncbi:MAG TPA: sugar transferase [Chitinophagales bacterium]|nr:sugar transferase [Chitinophagales bacterium]HQU76204.1 sugar transferase [Chitinophagales bacterium]
MSLYKNYIKPAMDRIAAFLLLLLLFPLLLLIMLIQWFILKDRIFFIHPRPGLHEKIIHVIKFRTMNEKKDESGALLPAMQRITPWGAFLRRTSLDELPQLINVLKGDLSFVGPRPLEVRYLPYYSEQQRKRHLVKPGITGLAQINGRNAIGWEEKFKYDLRYIEEISLMTDLRILLGTVRKVLAAEGVNQDTAQTVLPFDQYMNRKRSDDQVG